MLYFSTQIMHVCYFNIKIWIEFKEEITKGFSNLCDWFVNNKLSIRFDKTKAILLSTKNRKRKIGTLEIQYGDVQIKQYSKVTYLGCELDEMLSGGGYGFDLD